MVLYKDMGKVWKPQGKMEPWRLQAAPSVKSKGKEQDQNSSQKGQPVDRRLWPSNREAVSLGNHPRTKPEDFSLTHLFFHPPKLVHPNRQIQPGAREQESLWKSLSVNQTEKRKQHIQREKGKITSREIMWIAQIYTDLRHSWSIFFWTTTYTNRLGWSLIISTWFIFAAILGRHLFCPDCIYQDIFSHNEWSI